MNISFRSSQLERAYRQSAQAVRRWGQAAARKYVIRVTQLLSARDWDDIRSLKALRAHPLKGDRKGQWAIDMNERWRLVVMPSKNGQDVEILEVSRHCGD